MSVRAKKYLGQHFLKDERIAREIAETLSHKDYDKILEIGPGMGVLTKHLLRTKSKVTVMELDAESVDYLNHDFKSNHLKLNTSPERFQIIGADFLKQDLRKTFGRDQFAIIGNYPYNISSQIVFKAIENKDYVPEFSGMFQREVAQRIAAKEGAKTYGILSVLTQAFYHAEYLFTVPATVFNPPPKVESGVIRLTRKKDFSLPVDEKLFFRVVKAAFNQRRKMLRSSLKSFNLSVSLKEDAIFAMRPEQLSVDQFVVLTQKIAGHVI